MKIKLELSLTENQLKDLSAYISILDPKIPKLTIPLEELSKALNKIEISSFESPWDKFIK